MPKDISESLPYPEVDVALVVLYKEDMHVRILGKVLDTETWDYLVVAI